MRILQKLLLSSLIFALWMLILTSKSQAGEPLPNYVPLKMSFSHGTKDYGFWGTISEDMAIHVYCTGWVIERDENGVITKFEQGMVGPELFTPSNKDWKTFFDVCVSADIWDVGKEGRVISKDIAHRQTTPRRWWLKLEYPDRTLEIIGEVYCSP